MRRLTACLVTGLLAACATPVAGPGTADQTVSQRSETGRPDPVLAGFTCAIGPDGGPLIADRGIGGTGGPVAMTHTGSMQTAERGIGGTGIVGVVTGFASVCVNGLEVRYDNTAAVDIDGATASASALRVGQLVMIEADGPPTAPHARTISVRREVAGRIEAMELGSGTLTIAGMPVSVPAGTWGADRFGLGDWVAISGLRRPDGVIVASRVDAAPSDVFLARGPLVRDGSVARIGRLVLPGTMANGFSDGQSVEVAGRAQGEVTSVRPDTLTANPSGHFGPTVKHLILQAFVRVENGSVWIDGEKLKAAPATLPLAGPEGIAVVSLEREPDGSFAATALRYTDFRMRANSASPGSSPVSQGDGAIPLPARHASITAPTPAANALGQFQPPVAAAFPNANLAAASVAAVTLLPASAGHVDISPTLSPPPLPASATISIPVPTLWTPAPAPVANIIAAPTPVANAVAMPASAAPAMAPTMPTAMPPLTIAPAGAAPTPDSATSGLISLNNGPASRTAGGIGGLNGGGSAGTPITVPGSTASPTLNLVTTVGGLTAGTGTGATSVATNADSASHRTSTTHARRGGKH